ncbi:MAG: VTT domain-containing protein [Chloroflexi bacterium]|nr:VTT domain-containing protein [Chloroflexota bacterium]
MREDNPLSKNTELPAEQVAKTKGRFKLSRELFQRILAILFVVGVSASIFVFRDKVANLEEYGYLGAFLISLLSCATIILPIPGIALIFALGDTYNPFLIGLAAGAGSALGEISGYMAGYSGQVVIKNNKTYLRLEEWMKRRGAIVIFVLSFVPNPLFDLAGAAAGVLKYPVWKFLVFCFLGKTPKNILIALAGAWALEGVRQFLEKYF